ncbi:MAG: DUF5982 domain-containing protein [Proteobacteria bacterium]|nr:DUF5982 domain-containing protein [Pseudomonadota bacterium]
MTELATLHTIRIAFIALLASWSLVELNGSRFAQAEPAQKTPIVIPAPPSGFDSKPPIDGADLERKKERGYVTGLPLANFDPNTGIGGGVRAYYYFNGDRDDPLFAYTPYLHRIFAQTFVTTKGLQFHWLDYDAPAVAGTAYRLRSQLIYLRNTEQHFFGVGNETLEPLSFTGAGRDFDNYSDYRDALRVMRPDGTTLSRYDDYDLSRPIWIVSIERTFFKGLVRPLVGIGFTYADVTDYTGQEIGGNIDADAIMGPTRLREQCDMGRVVGCGGGWDNMFRFGISYDTRDFEPDPNGGVFIDMALDLATAILGSDYDYARFLVAARYYHSILPRLTDLVFGVRGTFQAQSKGTPFTSMNTIPWTEDPRTGLGGIRTLRGYRQDRFLGRYFTLINLELRWTYYRFRVRSQKFALGAVAFFDVGRVYDGLDDLSVRDWRRGQGGGFRVAWNQATIIVVDYGVSSEDRGLYINFSHQF